jgi:hypothetical protein
LLKIAHLILAYKHPEQVYRLARTLSSPNTDIFIHIDKKIDERPFQYIAELPNVHFIRNRHYIVWGGYSITECYITAMKEVFDHANYDYVVLMSGQDYPLKPNAEFQNLLKEKNGFSFMSVQAKAPKSKWWSVAVDRYQYYHLNDYRFYGNKFLHKVSKRILPKRQFLYPEYELYGGPGATFCALTKQAAEYIINFMQNNPKAQRYAKFTHASDEFWFQTILMNSPLKEKVINQPLWYIDWGGVSKHPRVLNVLDYPSLIASGMYFARKFDMYEDRSVMDMLDAHFNERINRRSLLAE